MADQLHSAAIHLLRRLRIRDLASGEADAVSLARAMLYDPRWPWHAAARLGARVAAPHQYWRSQPREYKDLFENAAFGAR